PSCATADVVRVATGLQPGSAPSCPLAGAQWPLPVHAGDTFLASAATPPRNRSTNSMQEHVTIPRRRKRIAATVLVLVGLVAAVGVGAFASFNAQTSNPGNLFADGTLVLSNSVNGGTACLSTAGGTTDTN